MRNLFPKEVNIGVTDYENNYCIKDFSHINYGFFSRLSYKSMHIDRMTGCATTLRKDVDNFYLRRLKISYYANSDGHVCKVASIGSIKTDPSILTQNRSM